MKKLFKSKIYIFIFLLGMTIATGAANAQVPTRGAQDTAFFGTSGLRGASVDSIVANIISIFLGLLGIVFVVLLIYAGFQWMTAEGNEEKVEKAKATITRAIIGLAIVIAAYAITYFVFNSLNSAAGSGGGGSGNYSQSSG